MASRHAAAPLSIRCVLQKCAVPMPDHRLKLLVITTMYEPDCVGIAAIASDMCAAMAARGHDVTVYTTYPYYPEWQLKTTSAGHWRIRQELIRDVQVRRHRIFIPSHPSRLFPRLLHELSFPISLLGSLFHRRQFDAVMVYCPLMGGVAFATLRKLLWRDPLWVNIQDIPVEAAAASGIITSRLLARLAALVQRVVLSQGDVWSSICPDMIEQLETIKKPHTPVHLCPNWLTNSLQEKILKLAGKVGRVPQRAPHLLYCGTIGKKQGLLEFCQRLSKCESNFHFKIRGEGGEADAVRRWAETRGDPRFDFGTLLPESDFVHAVHEADWFVIPQKSSAGSSFFPSKLIPAISVGTPILAISENTGPLGREVAENKLGLVIPWTDVGRSTIELDTYHHAPEEFEELQKNCLRRAQAFSRDVAIDRIEELLKDLHGNHRDQYARSSRHQVRSHGRMPTA